MDFHVNLIGRKNLSGEIYRQIRSAIGNGRLRPGNCLPASRELARSLGVSRTTVTVAYDRLAGEGFVDTRIGAGTYVNQHVARPRSALARDRLKGMVRARSVWNSIPLSTTFARPAQFDFRTGVPDAALFPHQSWRRLIARAFHAGRASAGVYAHPAGHLGLRQAIARHVSISRGMQTSPEDITITNGAQQAIDIIARVLLAPGDRVAVEDPGYPLPRFLFESLGVKVIGVPVDDEGLIVEALPARVRLLYVTPSHQYPLGVTMSLPRRLALLEWAERNNATIIEDDYDSEFRFAGHPIEPLQTLDTSGRVLYVGSFSKTLLPDLRLGFLATPPSCTPSVHKAKFVADWHTSMIVQPVLAHFIENGGFARHIRKVNRVYADRYQKLAKLLAQDFSDQLTVIPSRAGLHLTALAQSASVRQINAITCRAAEREVKVQQLSHFGVNAPHRAGLVLGYGAIPTARIQEGLCILQSCFEACNRG
jgi:GntR family transcriptional regulator/MocR family aminotransferase